MTLRMSGSACTEGSAQMYIYMPEHSLYLYIGIMEKLMANIATLYYNE